MFSLGRLLAVTLLIFLWSSSVLVSSAWAEDGLIDLSSTIITDNTVSQAVVDITVNSNQDVVKEEISISSKDNTLLEDQTVCLEDISVEGNNQVDISDIATSSAIAGNNQIVDSLGDVFINTGEGTVSGVIEDEINTEIIVLELPAESTGELIASVSGQIDLGQTVGEEKTLTVENNNEGTVINNTSITVQTGQNLVSESLGETQIETGDALASANLLNFLNTNITDSNFEFFLINLSDEEREEIDLNELWQQIQQRQATDSSSLVEETSLSELIVTVQNQVNLENNVEVLAETGKNQASQNDDTYIKTGNATALANVTNIVNTNILDSKVFFGIINILDSTAGDLILPRPEGFDPRGVIFTNQNQVEISNQIETLAETGANEENNNVGNNIIITGNATTQANTFSLVNLSIWRNNSFFLLINNLGNWTGKIFGWSSPEAVEQPIEGSQTYQVGFDEDTQEREDVQEENKNEATLSNNLRISALTGENQAYENKGDVSIQTGNALSLVNLFNLANLNILESRFFMVVINVLDSWSGNVIFTYSSEETFEENGEESEEETTISTEIKEEKIDQRQPKLEISVKNNVGEFVYPGDTVTFEITVRNIGEISSYNTQLTQELFNKVLGGFGIVEFNLGTIEAGKSGKLSFGLKLADNGELPAGAYYTIAIAKGFALNGHEVASNKARANFNIKNKKMPLSLETKVIEEKRTLGSSTMVNHPKNKEIFPYILLFVLSLLWLLIKVNSS